MGVLGTGPNMYIFCVLHCVLLVTNAVVVEVTPSIPGIAPPGFSPRLEQIKNKLVGEKKPSACKSCCDKLHITSSGGASNNWGDTLGQYGVLGSHNGKTSFSNQDNSNILYWNDDNFWAVGENYQEAKLFSTATSDCPEDTYPWYYFSSEGSWLEDASLTVSCSEPANCCENIELTSEGGSSDVWGETMGSYTMEEDQHNGKNQFKHKENLNRIYWNDDEFWAVSESYSEAKLYTPATSFCPDGTSPWFFFAGEGWQEDPTVNIGCAAAGECCNTIEITRSADHWGDTIGTYTRMSGQHNGRSQFQHTWADNLLYWNSDNDFGAYWAVGEDYQYAKLYSMDDTSCPKDTSSWMYYGDDGLWYEDNTMEIHCVDGTTDSPNTSTTTGGNSTTTTAWPTSEPGSCPVGWMDGSVAGLGCLYVDTETAGHHNVSDAQAACERVQHGSHLVEIFNEEQMVFLTEILADIEVEIGNENGLFWWLGLTTEDVNSGIWTWSFSGQMAEYTYWDEGEPLPQEDYNCAQMLSALYNQARWWASRCFDDYPDQLHVCQLHT